MNVDGSDSSASARRARAASDVRSQTSTAPGAYGSPPMAAEVR